MIVASGGLSHRFWPFDEIQDHFSTSPDDIIDKEHRDFDLRILGLLKKGCHAEVLRLAEEYRRTCHPEGRFSHYLIAIGALGESDFSSSGIQYGEYESAAGTGQAILWFDI